MNKKSLLFILLISFILLFSCENTINQRNINKNFNVSLGKDIANNISRTITGNDDITEDTLLTISFDVLRDDVVVLNDTKVASLKDIYKTPFSLKSVPYGNNYKISIKLFYKNILIYKAISNTIELTEFNPNLDLMLNLQEHKSLIKYDLDGGYILSRDAIPSSYFVNSNIILPEPKKEDGEFLGWYTSKDFSGEKITKLGSANFLGDVSLYAKWHMFDKVFDVEANNKTSEVDYLDSILLSTKTENADIYYTLDNTDPLTSNTRILYNPSSPIVMKDDNVTIKAYAQKDGLKASNVSTFSYKMKKYTVTFVNEKDGTVYKKIEGLRKNDELTKDMLEPTSKFEHKFNGWYLGKEKIESGYKVTKDITLSDSWTEFERISQVKFSVTGDVDYEDKVYLTNDTENVNIYYTIDGTEPSISDTKVLYNPSSPIIIKDDITIKAYAKKDGFKDAFMTSSSYKVKKYTVTLVNEKDGTVYKKIEGLRKNDELTKDMLEPTSKFEYKFNGWYLGKEKIESGYKVTKDITLSDSWTEFERISQVKFSVTGDVDYEDKVYLTSDTENVNIYYTIDGTDPTTSDTKVLYNSSSPIIIKDDITIKAYAKKNEFKDAFMTSSSYKVKKYTVTFLNNTLVHKKIENLHKNSELTADMLETLSKKEFKFNGWYLDNFKVEPGYKVQGNITLEASWTEFERIPPVNFSITGAVDFNDNVILSSSVTGAKIYYTLDGSIPNSSSNEYKNPIVIDKAMTIKAMAIKDGMKDAFENSADYTIKTYSVTFDNKNKGVEQKSITGLKKGDKIELDSMPAMTETGYEFIKWTDENGVTIDSSYEVKSNVKATAQWEAITYIIRFDPNKGKGVLQDLICTYDSPITLPQYNDVYTRSGYGSEDTWNTQADGKGTTYNPGLLTDVTNLTSVKGTVITLYAQWFNMPPTPISHVKSVPGNSKITITWIDPDLEDVEKIIINCDNGTKKEVPFGTQSVEFTGLTNGQQYIFSFICVDKEGRQGMQVRNRCFANPPQILTEKITPCYDYVGSIGSSSEYLMFGDWPQSLKTQNIDIIDESKTTKINGWDCYLGNDNCYYVKYKYDYYKMEPIIWRCLRPDFNGNGKALIYCEKALYTMSYSKAPAGRSINGQTIGRSNYQYSDVRAFLNGLNGTSYNSQDYSKFSSSNDGNMPSLLLNGFTDNARTIINSTILSDSNNVSDMIFLLSKSELQTREYGFTTGEGQYDTDPKRKGPLTSYTQNLGGETQYWTRTPNGSDLIYYVNAEGNIGYYDVDPDKATYTVQPAMVVTMPYGS